MTRNPTWSRDELILALELYMRHRERLPDHDSSDIKELSETLSALFGDKAKDTNLFRNPNGVYMKLANFRAVDPLHTSLGKRGLARGGQGADAVWTEFFERPDELKLIATAIRAAASGIDEASGYADEPGYAEAVEGRLLTRLHRARERSREIAGRKRAAVLRETGRLACEACEFDFEAAYGPHGSGFIEVHHIRPLHTLTPGSRTNLSDLAVVCANCHRMIHARAQWLTMSELAALLSSRR